MQSLAVRLARQGGKDDSTEQRQDEVPAALKNNHNDHKNNKSNNNKNNHICVWAKAASEATCPDQCHLPA
jgi:hypothetical protein